MIKRFAEVHVGSLFQCRGRRFQKISDTVAADEERIGTLFHPGAEVLAESAGAAARVNCPLNSPIPGSYARK